MSLRSDAMFSCGAGRDPPSQTTTCPGPARRDRAIISGLSRLCASVLASGTWLYDCASLPNVRIPGSNALRLLGALSVVASVVPVHQTVMAVRCGQSRHRRGQGDSTQRTRWRIGIRSYPLPPAFATSVSGCLKRRDRSRQWPMHCLRVRTGVRRRASEATQRMTIVRHCMRQRTATFSECASDTGRGLIAPYLNCAAWSAGALLCAEPNYERRTTCDFAPLCTPRTRKLKRQGIEYQVRVTHCWFQDKHCLRHHICAEY